MRRGATGYQSPVSYCWWKKSCTSWYGKYPIIYRVLYIPGGAGFCPSTVSLYIHQWCIPFHLDLALQQRICWDILSKGFLIFLPLQASHLALKFPLKIFSEMQQRSHASPSWHDHQTAHTCFMFKSQILPGFGPVSYMTCPPDVLMDQPCGFPTSP